MRIDRALIIRRLRNDISMEYAEGCAKSCEEHGLPYEFIDAVEHMNCDEAFKSVGSFRKPNYRNGDTHCCCHASHIKCWKRIIELGKPCLILEHDAVLKGDPRTFDLPDFAIVNFGNRVKNVDDYNPIGPATEAIQIKRGMGTHSYTVTPNTAQKLWDEARTEGIGNGIDRHLMMQRTCKIPLYMAEPPQAVCWVRLSSRGNRPRNQEPPAKVVNYPDSLTPGWKKGMKNHKKPVPQKQNNSQFYVFGLQRSGTNFIEQIITRNFGGVKLNRQRDCWKHSIDVPNAHKKDHPTFVIYKNPYTWVESLCLRNNVDWVKTQKKFPVKEGKDELKLGSEGFNVAQLARTYKHFMNTWVLNPSENIKSNCYIIKYEDLLVAEKRDEILSEITNKFGLSKKHGAWVIPNKGAVSQSKDYNNDREKYYLSMKPQKLNEKHKEAINSIIGEDIIKQLGYDIL